MVPLPPWISLTCLGVIPMPIIFAGNSGNDLVVGILSPGNTQKEMGIKFDLYEESGVKEYRLIEPQDKVILTYLLKDGKFLDIKPFDETDEIHPARYFQH